ncbi:hypothetical protein [Actinophytocola sp.]
MADQSVMDTPIFDALLAELGLEVPAADQDTSTSNSTAGPGANPTPPE